MTHCNYTVNISFAINPSIHPGGDTDLESEDFSHLVRTDLRSGLMQGWTALCDAYGRRFLLLWSCQDPHLRGHKGFAE